MIKESRKVYLRHGDLTGKVKHLVTEVPAGTEAMQSSFIQSQINVLYMNKNVMPYSVLWVGRDSYLSSLDRELYLVNYFDAEDGRTGQLTKVEIPFSKMKREGRCYIQGAIHHIFTRLYFEDGTSRLEYFRLDKDVIKYSLEGYLNALARDNVADRNATRLAFISKEEFMNSTEVKRMFRVRPQN